MPIAPLSTIPQACLHSHSYMDRIPPPHRSLSLQFLTLLHTQLIFKPKLLWCTTSLKQTLQQQLTTKSQFTTSTPQTPLLSWGPSVVICPNGREAWPSLEEEMECEVNQKPCKYEDQWWEMCKCCAFKQTATPNPATSQWHIKLGIVNCPSIFRSTINCPSISTMGSPHHWSFL